MRVGVIGINYKLGNLGLRELLAKACQRRFVVGNSTHGDHTLILLTTCNRTEVYFNSDNLAETHSYLLQILRNEIEDEFDQRVYSYFGYDCFLHLSRVTAGLDSAIIAETEIQGQVKAAYESALAYVHLPSELHYLFQKALKIGKKVRSELSLGRGMPDLEHAVFQTGMRLFRPEGVNILFVGASDVNQKILSFLKSKNIHNITVCNRSLHGAKAIAEKHSIPVLEWNRLSEWHHYNWIIFGTKAADYLVTKNSLPSQCCSQKLVIDLCVPRNVEPKLGRHPQVTLLNIDQINHMLKVRKNQMAHLIMQAEILVAEAAKQHLSLYQDKEKNKLSLHVLSA